MADIRNSHSHDIVTSKQVLIPLLRARVIGVNIDIWNFSISSFYLLHCSWDTLCQFLGWLQRAGVDGFEDAAPTTGVYDRWLIMTSLDVKSKREVLVLDVCLRTRCSSRAKFPDICISIGLFLLLLWFLFLWLRYVPLPIMAMPILKSCCMMATS